MKRQPRRRPVQLKLNILLIGSILAVALGLTAISYHVFCRRVDDGYRSQLERAAVAGANNIDPNLLMHFWREVDTDAFRAVRDRAAQAGDEGIIREWMMSRPGYYFAYYPEEELAGDDMEAGDAPWNLLDDWQQLSDALTAIVQFFGVDSAYYQIDVDGVPYNIADPKEPRTLIGTAEKPIAEFAAYPDNAAIPPTVYHSEFGWLCTMMTPVTDPVTGEPVAAAGVDIVMTEIVRARGDFLRQSLLFVVLLLAAAILCGVIVLRRTVTRPLKKLAAAATGFAREADERVTREDVIRLDLKADDEVGDLYREIRSMEERIVDNMEHLALVTAEKERVGTELRTAAQIQASVLPDVFPAFPDREDFDLYACMTPAREVGGDFYDFFLIDETHLAVLIADVSDKGVPAALFMMSSKILLSVRARQGGTPAAILSDVNARLCDSNKSRMFVTVWLGILDLDTGVMTCANAGHEYPFIRGKDGAFSMLRDRHGMVLGAIEQARYQDYEICLEPGDAVFVYTDGVPEANDEDGRFYGLERMEKALERAAGRDPEGILRMVREDVNAFTGDAGQFDDLTMLCVEYKGKGREKEEAVCPGDREG